MKELWNFFSREQTDHQYNPTLWTRRLPTDDLLPNHIDITTKNSNAYRKKMGNHLQTIPFGNDEYLGEMDVFRPENVSENAPIVVYIHGGWWQWFSKEQFSFLAEPFNKKGMAVYMPGYRMAQDWSNDKPMESIVRQMEAAVATILQEAYDKNSQAVYLVGHSAGGHLVTMLHKTDWSKYNLPDEASNKIKSIFSLAGLFDIRFLLDSYVNDEIKMSLESAKTVSPQLLDNTKTALCPIHLILPEFDTAEFFRQTKEYQDKLLEEKQKCHLYVIQNRDHLTIIENMIQEKDELFGYILKHMSAKQ
ncbi:alpha/beta hydrolase [Aquimarina hainanensis]|uniref:Alpha/beta hydrolase n=1 Tax=Aquimarina hainanensis TaxID=1578017 RepID=A0ABW5N4Z5_9FLAO